jgi:hypothetical protein
LLHAIATTANAATNPAPRKREILFWPMGNLQRKVGRTS